MLTPSLEWAGGGQSQAVLGFPRQLKQRRGLGEVTALLENWLGICLLVGGAEWLPLQHFY